MKIFWKKVLVISAVLMLIPGLVLFSGDNSVEKPKVVKSTKVITVKGFPRSMQDVDRTPLNQRLAPRKMKPVLNFQSPRKIKRNTQVLDPVVQKGRTANGLERQSRVVTNINGFVGMNLAQHGSGWPPDPTGDVGKRYYVQAVNTSIGIFNKSTGTYTTTTFDNFFSGPAVQGTPCDNDNKGDPIVLYDWYENRWLILDFAWYPGFSTGTWFSIAASQTSDPNGAWWLYALQADPNLINDYPKAGIWNDGIYVTANMFSQTGSFQGVRVWSWKKPDIYNGRLTSVSVNPTGWQAWSLLPSNAKGSAPPPARDPNYMFAMDSSAFGPPSIDAIYWWKATVNWATSTLTLTGPYTMVVAPFGLTALQVPQPGTTNTLDSILGRLMQPANYRNFGNFASVYLCHLVEAGNRRTMRWYEINVANQNCTINLQATYLPPAHHRWVGSICGDKEGKIAMGYSVSSSTLWPSIAVLDCINVIEAGLMRGRGSQLFYDRWGDYTHMTIDPRDDKTFWYTNEYYLVDGTNWQTWIGSFQIQ